jgi:hypothetical protein
VPAAAPPRGSRSRAAHAKTILVNVEQFHLFMHDNRDEAGHGRPGLAGAGGRACRVLSDPGASQPPAGAARPGVLTARLRYQQTKIDGASDTIPVDAEVIAIIPEQQEWAAAWLEEFTPQSPAGRMCSATSSPSPARSARAITGTSPVGRHEMRVIERRDGLRQGMQQSHLRGVHSKWVMEASDTPILPAQMAPFALTRLKAPLFDRWIEAEYQAHYNAARPHQGIAQSGTGWNRLTETFSCARDPREWAP